MTAKQKIAILRKMRAVLADKAHNHMQIGFCYAYVMGTRNGKECIAEDYFDELGLFKPKRCYDDTFWYAPENRVIRIKKIDALIKKLQTKKK